MLYPVMDRTGRMCGIVTRTMLETAVHDHAGGQPLAALAVPRPVVTHADETLRAVALAMAANEVDKLPVVDRDDPTRVIGIVSLTMLLAGRLRDLQEAREREQVLRLRIVRPRWLG
jgi:CBS domain-containing protein